MNKLEELMIKMNKSKDPNKAFKVKNFADRLRDAFQKKIIKE